MGGLIGQLTAFPKIHHADSWPGFLGDQTVFFMFCLVLLERFGVEASEARPEAGMSTSNQATKQWATGESPH